MKYRLKRDDGVELDVPGAVWEAVLERAYRHGWRPSGTGAPWDLDARESPRPIVKPLARGNRWPGADYFSACSQHVHATDAHELGAALLRGTSQRAEVAAQRVARPDAKGDAGLRKVADFARLGGFVIGRAPERPRTS